MKPGQQPSLLLGDLDDVISKAGKYNATSAHSSVSPSVSDLGPLGIAYAPARDNSDSSLPSELLLRPMSRGSGKVQCLFFRCATWLVRSRRRRPTTWQRISRDGEEHISGEQVMKQALRLLQIERLLDGPNWIEPCGPPIYERSLLFLLSEGTPLGLRRFSLLRRHSVQCAAISASRALHVALLSLDRSQVKDPLEEH
jgi:hypothetical protein